MWSAELLVEEGTTQMLWIRNEDRFNFDRALQVLQKNAPSDDIQISGALVEGTPVGEFHCYVNLSVDTPAFNLFMKNHGVTVYSEPGRAVVVP